LSSNLQSAYVAAVSRMHVPRSTPNPKRKMPIFQRDPEFNKKQAVKDAASALSALWNVKQPRTAM